MKLHDYGKIPEHENSEYYDLSELSEYDIKYLEKAGIEEAWYWYASGSYEGNGEILMKKGDSYSVHSMGHCSCYGPVEDIEFTAQYSSLDEIKEKCSEEAYRSIAPLVEMARA
jgi:hypothetical protein